MPEIVTPASSRHRHKTEAHYGFSLCTVCGARRETPYKPWAYGYGTWVRDRQIVGQWCSGETEERRQPGV